MLTDRQKEALRDDVSLCVTAGAGTGKTHVLVSRYIHLIENSGCRPSDILALTFTDKAASEMKERAEKEIFLKEGKFWDQIKEEMMWANISTFHSFCSGVLREFSLEAGLDPGYVILGESDSEEIIAGALKRIFHENPPVAVGKNVSDALDAFGLFYLEKYLRILYIRRRYATEFFRELSENPRKVVSVWQDVLLEEKTRIAKEFKGSGPLFSAAKSLLGLADAYAGEGDKATKYLFDVRDSLRMLFEDDPESVCTGLYGVANTKGGSARMGKKEIFGDDKNLLISSYSALKEYASGLPSEILKGEIGPDLPVTKRTLKILSCLGVVFGYMTEIIEREKRKRGGIDFTDMINLTDSLFKNHPDLVSRHFKGRYKFIMVDEFQDTDPVQADIVGKLLSDAKRGCKSLFIVGDPKQSIYLFRDADVTQFRRSGDKITEEFGGITVALDINFRSTNEVLSFVNLLFSRLLVETKRPWDFSYEPISVSDKRKDDRGSVELIICQSAKRASERAVLEAESVAKRIKAAVTSDPLYVWHENPDDKSPLKCQAGYGDIAVLLERRKNLKYLEHALSLYDIPYRVHAGFGLYTRQEITDVRSVLSFLKNPADDISLYALLRSPWFGFSDARLFMISKGSGKNLYSKLKLSDDEDAKEAFLKLSKWVLFAGRNTPSEIYRHIINDSCIHAVYAGISEGEQMIANIEKLGGIIREREKAGFYSLDRLVNDLNTACESNEAEGEAEPETAGGDSVLIMTVHASKGLEFPVVFAPGLTDSAPPDNETILVDDRLGVGIKVPDFDTGDDFINSPPLSLQKYIKSQKLRAESKRLFYVAATRARDHLIMSGTLPKELPASAESCKTRMDWIMHYLFAGLNKIPEDGIYNAGDEGKPVNIRVISAESMSGVPRSHQGRILAKPDTALLDSCKKSPVEKTTPSVLPRGAFSATEIEAYVRSPERHRKLYIERRPEIGLLQYPDKPDGRVLGKINHEIFSGRTPEEVLLKYGAEPDDAGNYLDIYRKFLENPFMQDVTETYFELPFSVLIGGYTFSGFIDRLIRKNDGWYVIDYKTGNKSEDDSHEIQMAVYKKAASEIVKSDVQTLLYYTQTGEFETPDYDYEKTLDSIKYVCDKITGAEMV